MIKQKLGREYQFEGDRNTKKFHTALKIKHSRSNIHAIQDRHGINRERQ